MGSLVFLTGAVAALHAAGGSLAPPPVGGLGDLGGWLEQRQPVEAAFAVLRLVALALAWYLLGATVLATGARMLRLRSLAVIDAVTVPALRRLVNGAVGLSLAASALPATASTAGAVGDGPAPAVETMRRLPDHGDEGPTAPLTMRRLPDGATPTPIPAAAPSPSPDQEAATWTVAPGDHFWSVAERVVADAWRRAPSHAETGPYWRSLVAANRSRLRDPANPDLLFPGQILVLPAPPAPGP